MAYDFIIKIIGCRYIVYLLLRSTSMHNAICIEMYTYTHNLCKKRIFDFNMAAAKHAYRRGEFKPVESILL